MKHSVDTGLDVLVEENFSRALGKRVAILANQASVNKDLFHLVDLAIDSGVDIVKLFAPEHGFFGSWQDMEHVGQSVDDKLKLPIISLYGDSLDSLKLKAQDLSDVDILICDLQDIGSRYYTFHCTIAWAMDACRRSGTELMVLDRPNPINADNFEGNLVKPSCFSFVGSYPLPNRHGFTMGELTHYVRDALAIDVDLQVVWMKNYQRSLYYDDIALPLVAPSPNMPTLATALVYPGMCLIEGTNLSEGRGTCTPFELVGAPYIKDPCGFKEKIDVYGFNGVKTRSCTFRPKFHKHADLECGGIFIHITDRHRFLPLRFALAVLAEARAIDGFDWRREPYEFECDRLAIDLLLGDKAIRRAIDDRLPMSDITKRIDLEEELFANIRRPYLHYR